jgi:hypothetical protein
MNGISECCGAAVTFMENDLGWPELSCKKCYCAVSLDTLIGGEGES